MRCTKAAACLWSLCCLSEGLVGWVVMTFQGGNFFRSPMASVHCWEKAPLILFHRRYIDSQVQTWSINSESQFLCFHSLQTWSLHLWHSIYGSSKHHIYLMLRLTLLTVGGRGIDIIQRQGLTKLQTLTFNLAMQSKNWSYPKPPLLAMDLIFTTQGLSKYNLWLIQENWPTNLNVAQLIRCQLMPNTIMSLFSGHQQLWHGHNWFL